MLTLSAIASGVWDTMLKPLAFLFVLGLVVFVHELGHFLVARWCGVKVKAFSMGFGPEICAFNDRHGTRWRLACIPLGGYVKFMDDENGASMPSHEAIAQMTPEERAGSFHLKPIWQRAAVIAAGPIANFLLAMVIFVFLFSLYGQRTLLPKVGEVTAESRAFHAGLKPGDLITSIDGRRISSFEEVLRSVMTSPERPMQLGIDRSGTQVQINIVPAMVAEKDGFGGSFQRGMIGIRPAVGEGSFTTRRLGILESLAVGYRDSVYVITTTLRYISRVVTGKESADQFGGPARVAEVAGEVAKAGFEHLLRLAAYLSISVGLVNLFPVPVLDGGHLAFHAIEALRGKPLSERTQEICFRFGFALILMMTAFVFWNDRFIIMKWVTGAAIS